MKKLAKQEINNIYAEELEREDKYELAEQLRSNFKFADDCPELSLIRVGTRAALRVAKVLSD